MIESTSYALLEVFTIWIIQILQHIIPQYSKICLILSHKQVFKIKTPDISLSNKKLSNQNAN